MSLTTHENENYENKNAKYCYMICCIPCIGMFICGEELLKGLFLSGLYVCSIPQRIYDKTCGKGNKVNNTTEIVITQQTLSQTNSNF
mgnify:CR=1 FL=1|jgi:hypothetical protein